MSQKSEQNRLRRILPITTAVVATLVMLQGCVGYRLGSTLPKDIRTVYVPTFVNATGEPQVEAETTAAAIREFQKDGTLRIAADERSADLVLSVTLTQSKVQGDTTFTLSGGIASSKKEALPDAAEDLAHSIVSAVVEAW
jgi:hypothetical protein